MGTNYYFVTKNRELCDKYFGGKYEEDDALHLFYIHLNKLSGGWKPIFEKHRCFSTFCELKEFYYAHIGDLKIKDEYNTYYSFKGYREEIMNHAYRDMEPVKWVYHHSAWLNKMVLDTVDCEPEEADLYMPFDHIEYAKTEREAQKKYGAWDYPVGWIEEERYSRDPDFPIDWVDAEFT